MAKDQGIAQTELRRRSGLRAAAAGGGPAAAAPPKKRIDPVQFYREVRAEARKVTWTSWKETWITSVMVGIMVVVAASFFFGVDQALGQIVALIFKFAGAGTDQ